MDLQRKNLIRQIGHELLSARKNAGISRISAAKSLNISEHTLYAYETGKREIVTDLALHMATLYDTTFENLTKYKELAKSIT